MKCPKCGGELIAQDDKFICQSCNSTFKRKVSTETSISDAPKQEPVFEKPSEVADDNEIPSLSLSDMVDEAEEKSVEENPPAEESPAEPQSEIEILKARLAEMEKKQAQIESANQKPSSEKAKQIWEKFKGTKVFDFLKKWGLKVCLPCVLVLITAITLMVCFIGVRGVYYNVHNPNEFYSFTASKYSFYYDFYGEETIDEGTWKVKGDTIYFTYEDELFGKQTDEYYFKRDGYGTIFVGEEKELMTEYKRVQLSKFSSSNKKIKVTFDPNGGNGGWSKKVRLGNMLKAPEATREGYEFKGWYTDPNGWRTGNGEKLKDNVRIWEGATYYANWYSDTKYDVTIDGKVVCSVEENDLLLKRLKDADKNLGYEYKYYIDGVLIDDGTLMPNRAITVTREIAYGKNLTLTFDANGGTFGNEETTQTLSVVYNANANDMTISVPTRTDYEFIGFKMSDGILVTDESAKIKDNFWEKVQRDSTLRAVWLNSSELSDYTYVIKDGVTITKYNGTAKNLKVPDSVTNIDSSAFSGCSGLTSVTIPNSVTSINSSAFYNCTGLEKIMVAEGNENYISKDGVLYNKADKSIHTVPEGIKGEVAIWDGVTSIGSSAFSGCTGLTSITIPNSVTNIGSSAFYGCTGLTAVYITDMAKWCAIGFGDSSANPLCHAKNLYLNGTLITDLVIPDSVTNISSYAFYNCSVLTSVTIDKGVESIDSLAFYECTGLTSITIPDSVTSISGAAFYNCSGLTSVTIGKGVADIGNYAFSGCTGLDKIIVTECNENYMSKDGILYNKSNKMIHTVPNGINGAIVILEGVMEIDSYTFRDCGGLASITIPASVKSIGDYVFYNCTGLEKIIVAESNENYISKDGILYNKSDKSIHTVPMGIKGEVALLDGVTIIRNYDFNDCTGLTSITIPDSVTTIGEETFRGCTGLTNITIPDSVTSIGKSAFSGCSGLTDVTIGEGVESIDSYAFYYCYGLTTMNWNATACTSAGSYSFSGICGIFGGCKNLTKVNIGDNVTIIPDYVFYGCTGLTSVIIPDSVTSIGESAFCGCSGLTDATIGKGVESIRYQAFYNCTGLTNITIPDSMTTIYEDAFYGCTGITTVNWNAIDINSKNNFFSCCKNLTTLNFGNNVTIIPSWFLDECSGLTSITIPDSVTSIGRDAFYRCKSLKSITFEDTSTWYVTDEYDDWCNKTNGTQVDVTNSSENAKYLTSTYRDDYWYKV